MIPGGGSRCLQRTSVPGSVICISSLASGVALQIDRPSQRRNGDLWAGLWMRLPPKGSHARCYRLTPPHTIPWESCFTAIHWLRTRQMQPWPVSAAVQGTHVFWCAFHVARLVQRTLHWIARIAVWPSKWRCVSILLKSQGQNFLGKPWPLWHV